MAERVAVASGSVPGFRRHILGAARLRYSTVPVRRRPRPLDAPLSEGSW